MSTSLTFRLSRIATCAFLLVCFGIRPQLAEGVVLIDGTAPGYVLNGSFESGDDGNPVDWLGADTGSTLAADLGIDIDMVHRQSPASASDGNTYTVVGTNGTGNDLGVYVDTGYDLAIGDTFDLSFFHGNHTSVDAGDMFQWSLFTTTTNDDSGVVDDIIASGSVSAGTSTTLSGESLMGIGTVTAASTGERLFLAFTPAALDSDFIAIDQVNLSASSLSSVPEPSTIAVCLVGLLGFVGSRRRGR